MALTPRWLPLVAAAAVLWGCGEGGCGEEPQTKQAERPASGGAASTGGGTSSGEGVKLSPFDGNRGQARGSGAPAEARNAGSPQPAKAAQAPAGPSLDEVTPGNFQPRVQRASTLVLLQVYEVPCEGCDIALPVLVDLSKEYKGRVSFLKMNGADPECRAKLPKGLLLTPYPGFVLYEKGAVKAWRQGLPLRIQQGEELQNFRLRLADWFRGALAKKDLS